MIDLISAILAAFAVFFRTRLDISLEVLALRHQVAMLRRKRRRPVLSRLDRLFWIMLRSVWPRSSHVLTIVKPATVIAWHRRGFRLYWRWRSKRRGGQRNELRSCARLKRRMGWLEDRRGQLRSSEAQRLMNGRRQALKSSNTLPLQFNVSRSLEREDTL